MTTTATEPRSLDAADLARLARNVEPTGFCWYWAGRHNNVGRPYIQLWVRGEGHYRCQMASRWVYEVLVGPIPVGLDLDHLCRNKVCVNPDHVEPVTRAENMARRPDSNQVKTHCARGHDLRVPGAFSRNGGSPTCRLCINQRARERRARPTTN